MRIKKVTDNYKNNISLLENFIRSELTIKQPSVIVAASNSVSKRFKGHVDGVLFYGSCLRTGEIKGKVLDFYIIIDDYKVAYSSWVMGLLNKLLPPNVYYDEFLFEGKKIRSKFAVLSIEDYIQRTGEDFLNVSVWARFSQPAALVYAVSPMVENKIIKATSSAVKAMILAARPMLQNTTNPLKLWSGAFGLTYGAELRSEKPGKGLEVYDLNKNRYDTITPIAISELLEISRVKTQEKRRWFWRRVNGKFVSLARLIKATFTFDGGIDYLAWKVSQHSGVEVKITPWQRKHPILGGISLFLKLRKKGVFR